MTGELNSFAHFVLMQPHSTSETSKTNCYYWVLGKSIVKLLKFESKAT